MKKPREPVVYGKWDPKAFEIYMHWIYSGTIPVLKLTDDDSNADAISMDLLRSYLLGDRVRDNDFKKAILQEIVLHIASRNTFIKYSGVKLVYDNTTGPCNLRALLVDLYTMRKSDTLLRAWPYPAEFVRDLVQKGRTYEVDVQKVLAAYLEDTEEEVDSDDGNISDKTVGI